MATGSGSARRVRFAPSTESAELPPNGGTLEVRIVGFTREGGIRFAGTCLHAGATTEITGTVAPSTDGGMGPFRVFVEGVYRLTFNSHLAAGADAGRRSWKISPNHIPGACLELTFVEPPPETPPPLGTALRMLFSLAPWLEDAGAGLGRGVAAACRAGTGAFEHNQSWTLADVAALFRARAPGGADEPPEPAVVLAGLLFRHTGRTRAFYEAVPAVPAEWVGAMTDEWCVAACAAPLAHFFSGLHRPIALPVPAGTVLPGTDVLKAWRSVADAMAHAGTLLLYQQDVNRAIYAGMVRVAEEALEGAEASVWAETATAAAIEWLVDAGWLLVRRTGAEVWYLARDVRDAQKTIGAVFEAGPPVVLFAGTVAACRDYVIASAPDEEDSEDGGGGAREIPVAVVHPSAAHVAMYAGVGFGDGAVRVVAAHPAGTTAPEPARGTRVRDLVVLDADTLPLASLARTLEQWWGRVAGRIIVAGIPGAHRGGIPGLPGSWGSDAPGGSAFAELFRAKWTRARQPPTKIGACASIPPLRDGTHVIGGTCTLTVQTLPDAGVVAEGARRAILARARAAADDAAPRAATFARDCVPDIGAETVGAIIFAEDGLPCGVLRGICARVGHVLLWRPAGSFPVVDSERQPSLFD